MILNWIQGFEIPFYKPVIKNFLAQKVIWLNSEITVLREQISKLISKGAISLCKHTEGEFIFPIFLTPKHGGSIKLILNLKRPNEFILTSHFELEDIRTAKSLMSENCYFATLDFFFFFFW